MTKKLDPYKIGYLTGLILGGIIGVSFTIGLDIIKSERLKNQIECIKRSNELEKSLNDIDKASSEKTISVQDKKINDLEARLISFNTNTILNVTPKKIELPGVKNNTETNPLFDNSLILIYANDIEGKDFKTFIDSDNYLSYKAYNHIKVHNEGFVNYVTHYDQNIKKIAKDLTKDCKSKENSAKVLYEFTKSIVYDCSIEENSEYVKFPIETIVEGNGDCEDTSILGATLMKSIGIDVALLHYPGDPNESGHMALGICGDFSGKHYTCDGKKYFYAETTGTNWPDKRSTRNIGEIPEKYKDKKVKIYVIEDI